MKIAISSDGKTVDDKVDMRFGRCAYFVIVDVDGGEIKGVEAVENQGVLQGHGAGIKAAQQIGELRIEKVITGNLGPNADQVLSELGIETYQGSGVIKEAVKELLDGKLQKISQTVESHAGMDQAGVDKGGERIFFPLLDNNGEDSEISEHFGHAPFFGLYDVENKKLDIIENDLDHTDPTKSPIDQIEEAVNPTTIFAKGIGGRAIGIIAEKGLSLKTGDYKTVKEVIENLDKLEDLTKSCGH